MGGIPRSDRGCAVRAPRRRRQPPAVADRAGVRDRGKDRAAGHHAGCGGAAVLGSGAACRGHGRARHHQQRPGLLCVRYRPPTRGVRALRRRHPSPRPPRRRETGPSAATSGRRTGGVRRQAHPHHARVRVARRAVHHGGRRQRGRGETCGETRPRCRPADQSGWAEGVVRERMSRATATSLASLRYPPTTLRPPFSSPTTSTRRGTSWARTCCTMR